MNKNIEKNILQKINLYLHPDEFISLEKAVDQNKKELLLGGVLNYIFCYRPWGRDDQLIGNDEEIDYLIKNSDLKMAPPEGWPVIMHAFNNNKRKQLNLNRKQINYLIKNSDLKFKGYNGTTALHLALMKNATEELMLTEKMMQYLVFNSDLNIQSRSNSSILSLALNMSTEKKLPLDKETWEYLIKNSKKNNSRDDMIIYYYSLLEEKGLSLNLSIQMEIELLKKDPMFEYKDNEFTLVVGGLPEESIFRMQKFAEKINVYRNIDQKINRNTKSKNLKI